MIIQLTGKLQTTMDD